MNQSVESWFSWHNRNINNLLRSYKDMTKIFFSLMAMLTIMINSKSVLADLENNIQPELFVDTYYSYDFNTPGTRNRDYFTQSRVDTEYNLNLSHAGFKFDDGEFYGRLVGQYGTSVDANYSSEPWDASKYIQESYVGYKVSDKLKIDGGIYLSHIGLESFISRDNQAYTRSFVAEFSPYYQSGLRAEYKFSDEYRFQLHLINGWQNISADKLDPSIGTQFVVGKDGEMQLFYNTFIGEREHGIRTLNDFVLKVPLTEKLTVNGSFDYGFQNTDSVSDASWYGYLVVGEYKFNEFLGIVGRYEQYVDPDSAIVTANNNSSFQSQGFSFGLNIYPIESLSIRTEYRNLQARKAIYRNSSSSPENAQNFDKNTAFFVTSLAYSF